MPGPGPHIMYALGSGLGLMTLSSGGFGPHHCLAYAINAFFGPDVGSFTEWLTCTLGLGSAIGTAAEDLLHHPFYYPLILGFPLSLLYSAASRFALRRGFLDSSSGVPLSQWQCFQLISASSLSHFFLDHLFEEDGHSSMYTWILSTGWWSDHTPINPDAVIVVGFLCACLILGFVYINRVKSPKCIRTQHAQSVKLILVIGSLYCLWCVSQIYLVTPPRPAIGEEPDLGVIVFLLIYFFTPHYLCIKSMSSTDFNNAVDQLPL